MTLDEKFRALLQRTRRNPPNFGWLVAFSLAVSLPVALNGNPYNPGASDSSAQRLAIERAVDRCQAAIKGKWRYATPTAGMAETIVESDRVIVRQRFTIGALRDEAICDVNNEGRVSVARS